MAERANGSIDPLALLRVLHDEKLGVEHMAHSARLLQRVLKPMRLSKDACRAMRSITVGCERLLGAYRDMGEAAAMCGLCARDADLVALARRTMAQHAASALLRGVRLRCRCRPSSLQARVDPVLIERLLENLISNAIAHVRRGGLVLVKLTRTPQAVEIGVYDDGVGIPEALLPHIFEPRMAGGSGGLGLSNVKYIAELHGGSVRCASRQGVGTQIVVTLPQ